MHVSIVGIERRNSKHGFFAALRQFYRFAIERRDYWYEGNPAEAFNLPLRSRLLYAMGRVFRSSAGRHPSSISEGGKVVLVQRSTPTSPREEQPASAIPAEAWIQLVRVPDRVETMR